MTSHLNISDCPLIPIYQKAKAVEIFGCKEALRFMNLSEICFSIATFLPTFPVGGNRNTMTEHSLTLHESDTSPKRRRTNKQRKNLFVINEKRFKQAQAAKKEKDKLRNALKKEKKIIRTTCKVRTRNGATLYHRAFSFM